MTEAERKASQRQRLSQEGAVRVEVVLGQERARVLDQACGFYGAGKADAVRAMMDDWEIWYAANKRPK